MQVTEDFSRSICSYYPINSTKKLFASLFSEAPSVALLIISSFSVVQFSRCRLRSKTGSKHLNTFKCFDPFSGGDNRIRTDDLLRAKQALSHLSYTPSSEEIGGP